MPSGAVLGASLEVGDLSRRARALGATILFGVFVFSVAGVNEIRFWQSARLRIAETQALGTTLQTFIKDVGYEKLPVIVPSVGPFFIPCALFVAFD